MAENRVAPTNVGFSICLALLWLTVAGQSNGQFDSSNGSPPERLLIKDGDVVNRSGGTIGDRSSIFAGGTLNITGGAIGDHLQALPGGTVSIAGGEFRLDGVAVDGLDSVGDTVHFNMPEDAILSGTLADGTPFAFTTQDRARFDFGDRIADGSLTLKRVDLPAVGPTEITASSDTELLGIRQGQVLRVGKGAVVPSHFNAGRGSTVLIEAGGVIGSNLEAVGAVVNVSGGSIDGPLGTFDVMDGSLANITGGSIRGSIDVLGRSTMHVSGGDLAGSTFVSSGSVLNLTGGAMGERNIVNNGGTINISGGVVGERMVVGNGGTANITGGAVGTQFFASAGSAVNISGGYVGRIIADASSQIELSGGAIGNGFFARNGGAFTIVGNDFRGSGSSLSGTLADGTPFAFSASIGDTFGSGMPNLRPVELPPIGPTSIIATTDPVPQGIRTGQTVRVDSGAVVADRFRAGPGSTLLVESGGAVGAGLNSIDANVIVEGGSIGRDFFVFGTSEVTLVAGSIGRNFRALDGSTITIMGGSVDSFFTAHQGSVVNIGGGLVSILDTNAGSTTTLSGGTVRALAAAANSHVRMRGGSVRVKFEAEPESQVALHGGEFRLDGNLIAGLQETGNAVPLNIPTGSILSGTLASGQPFVFSSQKSDEFAPGTLTLHAVPLPPVGPEHIDAAIDAVPVGIRSGQSIRVGQGGVVPDNFDAGFGSVINVQSEGEVGDYLHLVGGELNVAGGNVGDHLKAFAGSTIHLTGGDIGNNMVAYAGAEIHLSSGSIGDYFYAEAASTVNVTGGSIGQNFIVSRGSAVTFAGGTQGSVSFNGATVVVKGGEFRVDGIPTAAQPLWLMGSQLLSGIFADGTPFLLSGGNYRTVLLEEVDLPPIGPNQVTASSDDIGFGIRQGQFLRVDLGGVVPDFYNAGRGSIVAVESGGIVGDSLRAMAAKVDITGGTVGDAMSALDGSVVTLTAGEIGLGLAIGAGSTLTMTDGSIGKYANMGVHYGERRASAVISGGEVGEGFRAYSSEVTISGGTIGSRFAALRNSIVNISGGTFGPRFYALDNSVVTISGGSFDEGFRAQDDTTVNLVGRQFVLDGVDVTDSLTLNVPRAVELRDVTLSGIFADGSPFEFELGSNDFGFKDYFDPDATLTIALLTVPEPSKAMLLLTGLAILLAGHPVLTTSRGQRK